jgi:hypothetical protein
MASFSVDVLEVISEFPKNEKQLSIKFKIMMNLPF